MLQRKGADLPQTSEEETELVREAYTRSSRKYIGRASTQFQILLSTIHKIVHKDCDFMYLQCSYHRPEVRRLAAMKRIFSKYAGLARF